ncbi:EF-P 5-aminopentanol modification-associated protein YfmH [Alkalicoccus urumqiensis]|uniref:Peptidase M16 n=1 Tax=Alkalicoccus urumqiensis TaxID=1548213 RepID=A0A2P6MFW2_ALKUR|nr:pitrilysin family protein [Alkalicoccus urumqiensis]PRO65176.1 peptidase M16 [Alkalicoccus urumqiensis]
MNQVTFPQLEETLYTEVLDNGLTVFLLPKEGFHKMYATFTTKYGSVDHRFVPIGDSSPVQLPDGIAHFLEHKMFEDEDGDIFQQFSKQGASANAFTSFTRTAYLFSSTSNKEINTTTLLDFVQYPYFTDETVEKEKGIIEQEIRMYEDNPDWQNFFGLLSAMYENHPVHIDIAGTAESIAEITKEHLYTAYRTFYHPANMTLFLVGSFDPEEMIELIRSNQKQKSFVPPEEPVRFQEDEPEAVRSARLEKEMPVQVGKCLVGIKEKRAGREGQEMLKRELALQTALEMLFGRSSEGYSDLFTKGLIDDSFSFDYTAENTFGFSVIGGDSEKPHILEEEILSKISSAVKDGFDKESFERIRRKKIGFFLRALNSPEYIANQFTRYHFNNMHLFDVIPVMEELTLEEVESIFRDHMDLETQAAGCLIFPEGEM